MKKAYQKPKMEVTEFKFSEHIADSGDTSSCYWANNGYWSHAYVGCEEVYHEGTGGWVDLNG